MPSAPPKLAFAGTPEFAAVHLRALIGAGLVPELVVCQPDRARGRGRQVTACPVKELAADAGIAVLQPEHIRHPDPIGALLECGADLLVVVAYGQILPASLLAGFRAGAYNVHASLLPRWRGAAPIQRAIEAGDPETGITLQRMTERLDAGNIVASARQPIASDDTSTTLHDSLARLGAETLVAWLRQLDLQHPPLGEAQDESMVTHARKLNRDEAWLDWKQDAAQLERRIRAFDPWPGARTRSGGQEFRIWGARALPDPTAVSPGTVLCTAPGELQVACGEGVLALLELQFAGGRRLPVEDVLNARQEWFSPGTVLG